MQKQRYSKDPDAHACGETQIMEHLLVCRLLEELCTMEDLTMATDQAIACVQH